MLPVCLSFGAFKEESSYFSTDIASLIREEWGHLGAVFALNTYVE